MAIDFARLYVTDPSQLFLTLAVSSARTLVAFSMLPIFSSRTVPAEIRSALAIAVSFPVAYGQFAKPFPVDLTAVSLIAFVGKEAAVGLLIGLGFGIFLAGLLTIGEIIDHQTGLTFTQNIDPIHGNTVSLSSQFLERMLFAALMLAGLTQTVVDTLYASYDIWPLGAWMPAFDRVFPSALITQATRLFALSLLLAAPVLLVLFIVDAAMGLLNRATPQLSVFHITLSLKSMVGVAVLLAALPMVLQRVIGALPEVAATLKQLLFALR